MRLEFKPLTPDVWNDFEELFGARGACGGCWCMWYRLKRSEYEKKKGAGNRRAMRSLVKSGQIPGLLAYADGQPVGWCSVAPREEFSVLARSRILKPLDDTPVWSIVCFFVDKKFRQQGVSIALLEAVVKFVRSQGGRVIEGYPVEPKKKPMPPVFASMGLASAYRQAGFKEKVRRSETRPIMRREVKK